LTQNQYLNSNGPLKEINNLSDETISIIGPRQLQNELMASFLKKETGATCLNNQDFTFIKNQYDNKLKPMLILLDCMEKDADSCLALLKWEDEQIFSRHFVALFNVDQSFGIEEKALERGVRGFFYAKDPQEMFPKAVRAIFQGELWIKRAILTRYALRNREKDRVYKKEKVSLTPREKEILVMIALGAKNKEIAAELFITSNTVKTHIYNVYKKINVPNRLQAALWVAKNLR